MISPEQKQSGLVSPKEDESTLTSILHDERILGYIRDCFETKAAIASEEDLGC